MTAEHDGIDALMAAITDEPLPDGADDAYLAEHRSATADIAALRAQLDIIGRALGGDPPKPAPAPVPMRRPVRRRAFRLALGSLAAAAAATVMVGFGWLVVQSGTGSNADSATSGGDAEKAQSDSGGGVLFGSPRYLACAYLVAEGEVSSAEPVAADPELVRVSVDLSQVYKPEKPGPEKGDELGYVIDKNTAPGLRAGDHVLFGVPDKGAMPDQWVIGETAIAPERERINRSLSESQGLDCS